MADTAVVDFLYNAIKYDLFDRKIKNPCKRLEDLAKSRSELLDKLTDEEYEKALLLMNKTNSVVFCNCESVSLFRIIENCSVKRKDAGVKLIAYVIGSIELPDSDHLNASELAIVEAGLKYRAHCDYSMLDFDRNVLEAYDATEDKAGVSFKAMSVDDCMIVAEFLYEAFRSRFFELRQYSPAVVFNASVRNYGKIAQTSDDDYFNLVGYAKAVVEILFDNYAHLSTKTILKNAVNRLDETSAKGVISSIIAADDALLNGLTIEDELRAVLALPARAPTDEIKDMMDIEYIELWKKIVSSDTE